MPGAVFSYKLNQKSMKHNPNLYTLLCPNIGHGVVERHRVHIRQKRGGRASVILPT